jgi:hypothetical protein
VKKIKTEVYRHPKVFSEDGGHEKFMLKPEPGQAFTPAGIERAKSDFASLLKGQFPNRYFRFVKVKQNAFNVIPLPEKEQTTVAVGEC